MKKLVVVRGPSGSGKTTLGWSLSLGSEATYTSTAVHEADDYFTGVEGYHFDASKLGFAHAQCRRRVEDDMKLGTNLIVVSNTTTTLKELDPYLELANQYGYTVDIVRTKRPWIAEVLSKRNKHNVDSATCQRQIDRYQEHPNEREQ